MRTGAGVLVDTCAGVRAGENVVIVTDRERLDIARSIAEVAGERSARPAIILAPPRSIDNEEPSPPTAAAMAKADVLFLPVTLALAHTVATRRAIAQGARVVSMSAFTRRMMIEGGLFTDFAARKPFCDMLAGRLTECRNVQVTNPAGTEIRFSLDGRVGNSHACIVREPGFTAAPNIEANTSPVEGTTNGVLIVDGSIPYYQVGVVREPVRFEIRNGFVTSITGGSQARFLDTLLAEQDDRFVYNIAQFAFGLNPDCVEFTGEMLNDEGVDGTIHFGIGTSSNLGGNVQAKTHFDAIIRAPTVELDGDCVLRNGAWP